MENAMEIDSLEACDVSSTDNIAALEAQITSLELAVAQDPLNALRHVELANALLSASKAYKNAGKNHESAMYQARSYDTYGRASELDPSVTHAEGIRGSLCTFQDEDAEKKDDPMDAEESSESSSDEDDNFEQEQYFYKMAKKQYLQELAKNPQNDKVRRRLAELMREHGDDEQDSDGDTTGSGGGFGKKRKMK